MPSRRSKPRRSKRVGSPSTRTRLIYIHGIGRQEEPAELRSLWDLALFGRSLDDEAGVGPSRMAYWADIEHGASTAGALATARVGKRAADDHIDVEAVLAEYGLDRDDEAAQSLIRALLARFDVRDRLRTGKKVLPLPAFLRRPLARALLRAFVGDTAAYFFDADKKRRMRARLERELPDDDEEVVLIAHSMGTVIAFEVLAARAKAGRPVKVRLLTTLGSPLGIREVQDFLDAPLAVPAGVRQWTNFADPFDPVALDKQLGNDFDPNVGEDGTVRIEDRLIVNERTTRGTPHAALGYLADPKVRRGVADALRLDTMSRFLVARDVAVALGDRHERQPVLIEIVQPGYDDAPGMPTAVAQRSLPQRIADATRQIERIVGKGGKQALRDARIDPLRHFVAAHLLPAEILQVTQAHAEIRVYSVWKSSRKRKLVQRAASALQADAAWTSYRALGADVHWAVLDTGVQGNHPHFAQHANVAAVWDCTKTGAPRRIDPSKAADRDGHGTHVSGILCGEEDLGKGKAGARRGLAPRVKLHVYKVLDDEGSGEDAWIIKALDHIDQINLDSGGLRIHGLNLSLGGPFDATVYGCGFSPICQELRQLWRNGVLVVVASGNEGKIEVETTDGEVELNSTMSIGDPANLEECIAVGSVHASRPHLYGVSGFSSRGPTADGRLKPDVVAPGERIESCNARWHDASDAYRPESGTSMAAPAVSGLLAAFLSARREFLGRPDEVKALLLRTCNDLGRDRYHQGHGMPNLMKMLLEA